MTLRIRRERPSRWVFEFPLDDRTRCHGLGERYGGLELRGRKHTLIPTDEHRHCEATDSMYQAVPFLLLVTKRETRALWLDSLAPSRWHLGTELEGVVRVELLSRRGFCLYLLGPGSLPQVVSAYTTLTGRAAQPPRWSLGHQQSRWSYPTQERVLEVANELRQRKIPSDTLVLDIDYMDRYRVFTVSAERFPDWPGLMRTLGEQCFRLVAIVDPAIHAAKDFGVFRDGRARGVFCRTRAGRLFLGKVWAGKSALPDFLREDVRRWWSEHLQFYTQRGVAGLWNDMNEPALFGQQTPLPPDARELPDEDAELFMQVSPEGTVGHLEVRSGYGFSMARAARRALLQARPNERPFVLTRSGYAGVQRHSAVWLGDNRSWFEHLRLSIPMLLNLGLSGVAFAGADVGGFGDDADAELLVRWYQTGIFYPFLRNHCATDRRAQEPWSFGLPAETAIRRLLRMRYRLLPYLEALFHEHRISGAPIMRPLSWHFPKDPMAADIDDQFLWGPSILVAPILSRGTMWRRVYLPAGEWFAFQGGPPLRGPMHRRIRWSWNAVPAFVRSGSVLPLYSPMQHTQEAPSARVTFRCYGKRAKGVYYEDDGITLGCQRGEYSEYALTYRQGKLSIACLHRGYVGPKRQYLCEAGGHRTRVDWPF
ncbi:TIM-barrel domain-containing protein [Myxococcota bacterium]